MTANLVIACSINSLNVFLGTAYWFFFTFDSLNTDFMLMIFTLVFQLFFNRGGGYVVVENGVIVLDLCC